MAAMKVKGPSGVVVEIPEAVATAMTAAGLVTEVSNKPAVEKPAVQAQGGKNRR